jgi:hypothetical protein
VNAGHTLVIIVLQLLYKAFWNVMSTWLLVLCAEMLIKRREAHARIGSLKSANENACHYTTQRKSDVA